VPHLNPDRLFPADEKTRGLARELYKSVADLPILSPHGHCDPRWFAENKPFPDPARLFITPDHYVFRMLCSQGIRLEDLGIKRTDNRPIETDGRKIWRLFAQNYHLFRATPSRMWLDHAFEQVFGWTERLSGKTADKAYDHISDCLKKPEFRPRALFERFNIELLATTEGALDELDWHRSLRESGWPGQVVTTYRPDTVVDPDTPDFAMNVERFGEITGENTFFFDGYLAAHRKRRAFFRLFGATATDHGHPTARAEDLPHADAAQLYQKALKGDCSAEEADAFRGHMLTEMARMSLDDGMTLQIHAGSDRNHNTAILRDFGRDKGFDIPRKTDFVTALKPLLNAVGMEPDLTVIVFTLDETAYARELAPLAGVYPALKLGPAWWFYDSPEGMRRYREMTTETAGFYNTAGFNDDTRAFCSIPARHDVARRVDSAYLADLVTTGRLDEDEAYEVIRNLSYDLAKKAYNL